jgi:hypothetical protein
VQLAVLTKWLGVASGIVPEPVWLARTKSLLTVEAGIILGGLLFAVGLFVSLDLVLEWGGAGFGALDPLDGLRLVIPAVTLMVVGMQGMAGALFAGAAELCWRSAGGRKGHD